MATISQPSRHTSSPSPSPSPLPALPHDLPPPSDQPHLVALSVAPSSAAMPPPRSLHTSSPSSPVSDLRDISHRQSSFVKPLSSLDSNVILPGLARPLSKNKLSNSTEDHNVLSVLKSHSKERSNAPFSDGKENYFLGADKVKGVKRKTTLQEAEEFGISTTSTVTSDGLTETTYNSTMDTYSSHSGKRKETLPQRNIRELHSQQNSTFTTISAPPQGLEGSNQTPNLLREEKDAIVYTNDASTFLNPVSNQGASLSTTSGSMVKDDHNKYITSTKGSGQPAVISITCCSKPPTYPRKDRVLHHKYYQNSSVQRSSMLPLHSINHIKSSNNMDFSPTFKELPCSVNTVIGDGQMLKEGFENSTGNPTQHDNSACPDNVGPFSNVLQRSASDTFILAQQTSSNFMPQVRRERLSRKSNLCPQSQRKGNVRNFYSIPSPSRIMGELNPGIIRRLRTRKHVRAVIEAIIGSSSLSSSSPGRTSVIVQEKKYKIQYSGKDCGTRGRSSYDKLEEEDTVNVNGTLGFMKNHFDADVPFDKRDKEEVQVLTSLMERSSELSLEAIEVRRHDEMASHATSNCDADISWKHTVPDSKFEDACDTTDLSSCWLELLRLDIKGRLSALKRSRRRVRGVIASSKLDKVASIKRNTTGFSNKDCRLEEMQKWRDFFLSMDGALCSEGAQLEKWLSQVVEMQPFCQKKGFVLPQWDVATCGMGEAMISNMGSATCMFTKATQVTS